MNRIFLGLAVLASTSVAAVAGCIAPVPAPLVGALGGPWGLAAACGVYGAYRLYKRVRR